MSRASYFDLYLRYRRYGRKSRRWAGHLEARNIADIISIRNHHIYGPDIETVVAQAEQLIDTLEQVLGGSNA